MHLVSVTDRRGLFRLLAGAALLLTGARAAYADSETDRTIELINAERRRRGLKPLTPDPALTRLAQDYAGELMGRGLLDHTGKDGSNLGQRLTRAGFRYRAAFENLASGPEDGAEVLMHWMRSEHHRRNILKPQATHCGLGRARNPAGGAGSGQPFFWTLLLAEKI